MLIKHLPFGWRYRSGWFLSSIYQFPFVFYQLQIFSRFNHAICCLMIIISFIIITNCERIKRVLQRNHKFF